MPHVLWAALAEISDTLQDLVNDRAHPSLETPDLTSEDRTACLSMLEEISDKAEALRRALEE